MLAIEIADGYCRALVVLSWGKLKGLELDTHRLPNPFLTAYDPSDLPGGSIDPLGFERGYLFLADKILPGLTNAAGRPRYFSVVCAGTLLAPRGTGNERNNIRMRSERVLLFERFWAAANVLASERDGELSASGIRGVALHPDDVREIARQALRYGQNLKDERVDRVFIHRTVENAVAQRLRGSATSKLSHILAQVAHHNWIEHPYGVKFTSDTDEPASEDIAHVDERGVHSYYEPKDDRPSSRSVEDLTQDLLERRERARRSGNIPILDSYFDAPSLWFGPSPGTEKPPTALSILHRHLFDLTFNSKAPDWKTRLLVMQALRRALLRESMLLRLLPEKADRDESGWGELLARRFLAPLPGQHESMAARMTIFAEDVLSASGSAEDHTSARSSRRNTPARPKLRCSGTRWR
jgi:hypothetical protein